LIGLALYAYGISALIFGRHGAVTGGGWRRAPQLSRTDQDHRLKPREASMDDKHVDKSKGSLKRAAGSLTGDKHLKNEARRDEAKGSDKNPVDKVVDTLPGRGTE
jgi:uncharacterized protein YjbJ (UPF0337 family)